MVHPARRLRVSEAWAYRLGRFKEEVLLMRTGNLALNDETFKTRAARGEDTMTIEGAVNKTALLITVVIACAIWSWQMYAPSFAVTGRSGPLTVPNGFAEFIVATCLSAIVVAMITIFMPTAAPYLAPLYACLEGLSLGALSVPFEARYPGIVFQTVALTATTLGALLLAYKSGTIKATENFKLGVVAATGGVALLYLVDIIAAAAFDIRVPFIHETGLMGIGFSLVVVCIAALNLVLDFDFIESAAGNGAPRYMEWYAAFGLLVTLIWLYVEILHLLIKLKSKD